MRQERYEHRFVNHFEPKLFGDYEFIVDGVLDGDINLKRRIALADEKDRGGLAVLKNALRNRKVTLPSSLDDILAVCEADQKFYEDLKADLDNIDVRGKSYRVRMTVGGSRMTKNFNNLRKAQLWRDRMEIINCQLDWEVD